jgi:cytoskeletal protein CcmA (bactofilin family)
MFNKKKQPPIKSLIAQGTRIDGNVTFHDGLRVDGEVVGDIRASDEQTSILVISEWPG